ncbi:RDD family protein [Nocardia sp. GCM10030253]|uniref:RDD family protein n=1 Tax=Nocardia sp. GCM10030253 TaxID=3273404 RepID=UPI00362D7B0C
MTHTTPSSGLPAPAREYQGRRAGVVTRLAAGFIDLLVVLVVIAAVYAGIAASSFLINPTSFHWPESLGRSVPLIGFVILTPYLTFCWWTTGRTYGNALLGLRVVDSRQRKLHLVRALFRALLCALFPIGLLWVAISRTNRSIQDLLAHTSVIYDWTRKTDTER